MELALRTYKDLYSKNIAISPNLHFNNLFPSLDANELLDLNEQVSLGEVKEALFSMKPWKISSWDGLHADFFQKHQNTMGMMLWIEVQRAFRGDPLNAQINRTTITLILKVSRPTSILHFQPISLCTIMYKIILKVIVNRLKSLLSKIVNPYQSNFFLGRHITDNIIIAQEVIHSMRRKKEREGKKKERVGWPSRLTLRRHMIILTEIFYMRRQS